MAILVYLACRNPGRAQQIVFSVMSTEAVLLIEGSFDVWDVATEWHCLLSVPAAAREGVGRQLDDSIHDLLRYILRHLCRIIRNQASAYLARVAIPSF